MPANGRWDLILLFKGLIQSFILSVLVTVIFTVTHTNSVAHSCICNKRAMLQDLLRNRVTLCCLLTIHFLL
jgi:hypothetical protein